MDAWFSIARLDRDTYVIREPQHWEETNCFLLCGETQALLIDTGLGVADLKGVVEGLTQLPVQVVLTHAHWDHIGGLRQFDSVAVHEAESEWLSGRFPLPLTAVKQELLRGACGFPPAFDPDAYALYQGGAQRLLREGDRLELGGRSLLVLHTPGHSPGHCCFYEPARKALFSGDLLYRGCLDAFYPSTDPKRFLASVRRLQALDVARIFPGHHTPELPGSMIDEVEAGLSSLEREGKLCHGSGFFDFGSFQVHL